MNSKIFSACFWQGERWATQAQEASWRGKGEGGERPLWRAAKRNVWLSTLAHLRPVEPRPTDETDENAKVSKSGGQKAKPAAHLWSQAFSKIDWQGERHGADAEAGQGSAEADGEHTGGLRDQQTRQAERQGRQDNGDLGMIHGLVG